MPPNEIFLIDAFTTYAFFGVHKFLTIISIVKIYYERSQ